MDHGEYIIWKAVALGVIVFLGNFFYTLITGRSIEEARSEKPTDTQNSEAPPT